MSIEELHLDFAGEELSLGPDDDLTFGRGAELHIDDNPVLHRQFGRLFHRGGSWWLRNEGSRLSLNVHDSTSPSSFTIAPGREAALTFSPAAIRFEAGKSKYEILIDMRGAAYAVDVAASDPDAPDATIDQSNLPVLGGQRLLLVALAESQLTDPHGSHRLPTNKSVAHRFGWSTTTFNRRLDRLCAKFAAAGVQGLVGGQSDLARNRRQKLVDHAISVGIITSADLALLGEWPES